MSNNYRALTRAYRPQSFEDIVSQEHVSNTLKNAIANSRLSHAYLFCGPRGVGKTTMARVLARTINEVDADVDGEELNNTLNIIEIDAASNNSVEDIRSLRERVRIPPQSGRYKVYIIDEIHMLSKSAFNALLKTLEEPPAHVIFIFATTEPHRILPTILSRCQRFDFRRITVDEIVGQLEKIADRENIEIDRESLHVIAKKADGALRDALGILDQAIAFCGTRIAYDELHRALNIVSSERMFELTDALIRRDASAGMALLHHLLHIGNDIQEFLGALTEHFRNLYLAKDSQNFYLIESTEETRQRYQEMAAGFSEDDLMRMMHILHDAQFSIRNAQQPRIHLEITLLKLFHMTRSDGLAQLLQKLEMLEQGLGTEDPSGGPKETAGSQPGSNSHGSARSSASSPAPGGGSPGRNRSSSASEPGQPPPPSTENKPTAERHQANYEASGSQPTGNSGQPAGGGRPSPDKEYAPAHYGSSPATVSDTSDVFGPSIRPAESHLTAVSLPAKQSPVGEDHPVRGNLALSPKPRPRAMPSDSPGSGTKSGETQAKEPSDLSEIEQIWPQYLEKVQLTAGNMVSFTLQKARPVSLESGVITLECHDSFTSDIIRDKQRRLCDTLREHFGFSVRFTSRLVEAKQRTDTIHDPYEHFSKLQKKDPKLKKIVDLFGAELEY
ncbi:DNA polymerase III subunit gamma/tau [Balneolales bacterium ANBcel1]|nr:DNA polymerase III subunit gamma/tau [Balneolales bacterium ANBcel1]